MPRLHRVVMKVAIFTDNDFNKVNGVTTTLRAVLAHAPPGMDLRIYTCDSVDIERPEYLGLSAFGVGIPYYGEMKLYLPPFYRFLRVNPGMSWSSSHATETEVRHVLRHTRPTRRVSD